MLAVGTIVARNYLAHARVLARSLRQHSGLDLHVLLFDDVRGDVPNDTDGLKVISPHQLAIGGDELARMAAIYAPVELATALKPWFLEYLLAQVAPRAVYFDPDVELFDPVDEIETLLGTVPIVLTPHLRAPIPDDGRRPSADEISRAGVFNLGFIGVSAAAGRFLMWWRERLRRDCIVAPEIGLFVDQRPVDFVPGYDNHAVLRRPGYNVAYWNLHERMPEWTGTRYEVEGEPLVFFHFSGFDPRRPDVLSRHQGRTPRADLRDHPALARLCRRYSQKLMAEGFDNVCEVPYAFAQTTTGKELDVATRRRIRSILLREENAARVTMPNLFNPHDVAAASEWWDEHQVDTRLSPLEEARLLVRGGPDVAGGRWWVGPPRRLVLRLLRHYRHHQRQVDRALIAALEDVEQRVSDLSQSAPEEAWPGLWPPDA